MSCLHCIFRKDEWILTKIAQIHLWEMEKNWLDFDDLDHILKVTGGQRMLNNALSALYFLNKWMDFNQSCIGISFGDFGDLGPTFKVTRGQRMLKNVLSAFCRLKG